MKKKVLLAVLSFAGACIFGADWHCFYLISGLENLLSLLFF